MDKSTGALVLQNYEAFLITVLRRLRPCLQPAQERDDRGENDPRSQQQHSTPVSGSLLTIMPQCQRKSAPTWANRQSQWPTATSIPLLSVGLYRFSPKSAGRAENPQARDGTAFAPCRLPGWRWKSRPPSASGHSPASRNEHCKPLWGRPGFKVVIYVGQTTVASELPKLDIDVGRTMRYIFRDRDGARGATFIRRLTTKGIRDRRVFGSIPRAKWTRG